MTHNGPVDTIRSSSLLLCASKEGYETPQQQWMSLLIAYHPIWCAERLSQIWYFVSNSEGQPWQKWHDVNHWGFKVVGRSSSHLSYTSKEHYEILHKQWVSLLVAHHPISCADMVSKIQYSGCNWRIDLGRNSMTKTIRGLLMLPEASPNLIVHLRKDMSPFSSNWCLSS